MNVVQTYRSLSAEQKQILGAKQADLRKPIDELLAILKPLAACDKVADKARTPLGCTFALSIVALIASLIIFSNNGWGPSGYAAIGLVVFILIASSTLFFWTRGVDMSNNVREFVLPVLTVFREDIDPARPVHLKIDLRSPTDAKKKTGESAPFKKGAYHKIIDTMYLDEWMTASAYLIDGTKVSWKIADTIRERKKTKRNARGKYKTKTKYKKKTDLEVEVALRKKTYDLAGKQSGELTSDDRRNTVHMETKLRSDSLNPVSPRVLIDLVTSVYRKTRPAARGAQA
jgi:hypothetical protein